MVTIKIKTDRRSGFVDITAQIQEAVAAAKIKDGICLVFCPHTTAGMTINENADPAVKADIIEYLEKLVPENSGFSHSEGNSDAHIKSSLMGSSLSIIIENSKLILGTWQGIYFCEFDGPRNREIYVKAVGNR